MLLELEEQDIEQIYIDLERFINNEMSAGFSKINFKDYSPIIQELRDKYPTLKFELKSYGIAIDKIND